MKCRTEILLLAGLLASSGTGLGAAPSAPARRPEAAVSDGSAVVRTPEALLSPLKLLPPAAHLPRLRVETDPVRREQARLRRRMQLRALSAADDSRTARGEKKRTANGLRVVSGNTADDWSPYRDRALDARVIRYPLRLKSSVRRPAPAKQPKR